MLRQKLLLIHNQHVLQHYFHALLNIFKHHRLTIDIFRYHRSTINIFRYHCTTDSGEMGQSEPSRLSQKMIDETDDEWLEHVYQTNVFGPFRFIRESLKVFLPKNEGCIINISSVNGDRPFCGASYTSSKGAINTLTKNVAMRLIDTNIRINAVAPGATVAPAHLANKAGEQPGGAKMQAIAGTMNPEHLKDICAAAEVTLTRHEWYQIYLASGKFLP